MTDNCFVLLKKRDLNLTFLGLHICGYNCKQNSTKMVKNLYLAFIAI